MFKFREIKEVKEEESIKERKNQEDGFKKIKPEGAITFEEACSFWEQEFARLAEES